jgi:hypothetical protein
MENNLLAVIVCGWLAVFMNGCAPDSSSRLSVPVVPDAIKVSPTDTPSFAANAKGVQIYECRAKKDDVTQYEWVLKAPEADLFDERGKRSAVITAVRRGSGATAAKS